MSQSATPLGALSGRSAKLILNGQWIECRLSQLTAAGASVEAAGALKLGYKVVACISEVGAIPGAVTEYVNGQFAIRFAR